MYTEEGKLASKKTPPTIYLKRAMGTKNTCIQHVYMSALVQMAAINGALVQVAANISALVQLGCYH